MTEDERQELRELLAHEVERLKKQKPSLVLDSNQTLDEDGAFVFTEAEVMVFRLDPSVLHPLVVAAMAYEELIGICDHFGRQITTLIHKAREDCPPVRYFDSEHPFRLRCEELQWFQWLAKDFLDVPLRQSRGYHAKYSFNMMGVVVFPDD